MNPMLIDVGDSLRKAKIRYMPYESFAIDVSQTTNRCSVYFELTDDMYCYVPANVIGHAPTSDRIQGVCRHKNTYVHNETSDSHIVLLWEQDTPANAVPTADIDRSIDYMNCDLPEFGLECDVLDDVFEVLHGYRDRYDFTTLLREMKYRDLLDVLEDALNASDVFRGYKDVSIPVEEEEYLRENLKVDDEALCRVYLSTSRPNDGDLVGAYLVVMLDFVGIVINLCFSEE